MLFVPQPFAPVSGLASENASVPTSARSAQMIKLALVLVLICNTFLSRFGVSFGSYSLNFDLIAQYILLAAILFSGVLRFDGRCVLFYACCVIFSCVSYLFNRDYASITSLLLLLTLYFPFVYTISPALDVRVIWLWTMRVFGNVALICAVAGIAQFFAQFFFHQKWLFDFIEFIPPQIRGSGIYNTVIPIGSLFKSNGFFFQEPSGFSQFMAMAFISEWVTVKRWSRMAVFGLGLLLSYSGTGILILFIASLFPLDRKTIMRVVFLGLAAGLVLLVLGDVLDLWVTVARLGEFGSETSSGYARFIGPFRLLQDLFVSDPLAPFFGHGPGMISRTIRNYAFHDPTWAKALFEYGMFGAAAIMSLVIYTVRRFPAPAAVKAVVFFSWFLGGGGLLNPWCTTMIYLLVAIWPAVPSFDAHQPGKTFSSGTMSPTRAA